MFKKLNNGHRLFTKYGQVNRLFSKNNNNQTQYIPRTNNNNNEKKYKNSLEK